MQIINFLFLQVELVGAVVLEVLQMPEVSVVKVVLVVVLEEQAAAECH